MFGCVVRVFVWFGDKVMVCKLYFVWYVGFELVLFLCGSRLLDFGVDFGWFVVGRCGVDCWY